ncbi:MAG: FlgO family outer membrane protein [Gemmatimonas sp.]
MDDPFLTLRAALKDRYDLDRLIGRGGMANVYLATDLRHGRPVAVKVLRANFGDEGDTERFALEIETAARLQHPNILPVYDSGEANGALFFVMPYVEGETLRRRLERERVLSWPVATTILREIGDALAFAHSRNVIHRDIKPENILFFAGHAVVADFGIAKVMQAAGNRLTLEGHGVGTPEYMSPEQAFGEAHIDARTDVYAFSCIAYEMLSGEPPWSDQSPLAILLRKNHEDPPVLRILDDGIPSHVPGVLKRGLARDPIQRYPDIASLMAELDVVTPGFSSAVVRASPVVTRAIPEMPSIAVLPFANLGKDTTDEYLSDGISEELIHGLAQAGGIRVVARTSSFRFRNSTKDVREIGQELRVESVLEGSVRRQGNRLRITARLIDTSNGFEKWSERYEREFTDVFAMQDDIARSIVASLEGTLRPSLHVVIAASTNDMHAYELFLEGRYCWNQRTAPALRRSVDLLQRAVQRDPLFAAAHAALAEACVTMAVYGIEAPAGFLLRARGAAERSLELRAGYTDALVARASVSMLLDWARNAAEADFKAAVQSPHATATAFQSFAMNLLVPQHRFGEARSALMRAKELDPLSPVVTSSVGVTFLAEGNFALAEEVFQKVLERDPQFGMAHYFMGRVLDGNKKFALALESLALSVPLLGDSLEPVAFRAVVQANAGRKNEAREILADLDTRAAARYVSQVMRAEIAAALGETDDAISRLQIAAEERAADLMWIGLRPAFQSLQKDARFRHIAARVGVPAGQTR